MDFLELNMTDYNTTEDFSLNGSMSSMYSTDDSGLSSYSSCDEVYNIYGNDGAWCWHAHEGDYLQVFIISLLIWSMYLAAYCLAYARTAAYVGGLSESMFFIKSRKIAKNIYKKP